MIINKLYIKNNINFLLNVKIEKKFTEKCFVLILSILIKKKKIEKYMILFFINNARIF